MLKRLFKRLRKAESQAEEPTVNFSLTIEGVEVYAVEGVPTGKVQFCAPGHPCNPLPHCVLVCNLETYVSLAANSDSQRLVALMVQDSLRVLKLRQQAEERRANRARKRQKLQERHAG